MLKNDGYHEDKLSLVLQNSEKHYDALQSEVQSDKIDGTGKLYEIIITPGTKTLCSHWSTMTSYFLRLGRV